MGGLIDTIMQTFHDDVFIQAQVGPPEFPPKPPPLAPVTFAAYNKWVTEVANAVIEGVNPSQSTGYAQDAQAAFGEVVDYSGIHYKCLNVPGCMDVDLQRAELQGQGLHLGKLGIEIAKTFMNQSSDTRTAAAAYLQKTYTLTPPNY